MARKYIQQKAQSREQLFDAVVKNAIDFVNSSVETLERRTKNAIVEFYTAVELFLKARLMAEPWTLILGKPESANLQALSVGDFHSVYLEDAAKRLKDIVGEAIDEKAMANFRTLNEHRNQSVHFAHTDYQDVAGSKAGVVVELWASWHYLHALLPGKWAKTFGPYQPQIAELHKRMMAQADFVSVRFREMSPQIQEKVNRGSTFVPCNRCRMEAGRVLETHRWGSDYRCFVWIGRLFG